MNSLPDEKKLRWMCRRGLLELDLILTKILDTKYALLSDEQKQLFILMLEESDTDLLAWLLNQTALPKHWSPQQVELVSLLR